MHLAADTQTVSVKQARRILGTTAKGMSDEAVKRLISQTELLAEIVIAHADGSKIKGGLFSEDEESILKRDIE